MPIKQKKDNNVDIIVKRIYVKTVYGSFSFNGLFNRDMCPITSVCVADLCPICNSVLSFRIARAESPPKFRTDTPCTLVLEGILKQLKYSQ